VKVAYYTFRITSVTINHARSRNTDTNHSTVSVFVNKAKVAQAFSSDGDRADGTYHPTVVAAKVAIPRTSVAKVVNTVMNIGGSQGEQDRLVQAALNTVVDCVVACVASEAGPLFLEAVDQVISQIIDGISKHLHTLCNGLVWMDGRALGGEWLFQNTTGGRAVTFTREFPGLPSPSAGITGGVGCDKHSLYSATLTVSRQ
jgi:hypothetical protein